ncbi:hypothetical protein Tcur_3071 [Thermomonospora curvata DSM 43183]|uniref:Uncharacterized protein n=1 Tax=Thermomonospora curvata (strain ATCC 19995 / DSM 43183 / JCM 3096 / KCTC 9072 / NBRC 15933 / NCIMB 10081 / Henssen B9) TaxID=471852 RepID=D1A8X5_THECD|nr:hypothetical protein Tcur_3071 [Thermomonospora curvata DSM 43183]
MPHAAGQEHTVSWQEHDRHPAPVKADTVHRALRR